MKFSSWYFINIPKTGSSILERSLFYPLQTFIEKNSLPIQRLQIPNENDWKHKGWIPEINDKTYLISVIRDPLEYLCSWFTYFAHIEDSGWAKTHGPLSDDPKKIKEQFLYYFEENSDLDNIQSKYLSNAHIQLYPKNLITDPDIVNKNTKRVNLLFTTDFIQDAKNIDKIRNLIRKDLEIDNFDTNSSNLPNFRNIKSSMLYDSLTVDDIEKINKIIHIDRIVYEEAKKKEISSGLR